MAEKNFNSRLLQKTDTSANWAKAVNFTPKLGEIIVYSDLNQIKVGNGITLVNNLPFLEIEAISNEEIDEICGAILVVAEENEW